MSYTIKQLLVFTERFEKRAIESLKQITKFAEGSGYSGEGGHSGGGGASESYEPAGLQDSYKSKKRDLNSKEIVESKTKLPDQPKPSSGSGYAKIDPYVQRALNQLGYSLGKPDSILGPATRKAIDKFKSDRGMHGTDSEVFQLIQAEYKNKFPGMQTTYNDPSYSEKPVTASRRYY